MANKKNAKAACKLLKTGVIDIHQPIYTSPVLVFAARYELIEVARLLLEIGADINGRDGTGEGGGTTQAEQA